MKTNRFILWQLKKWLPLILSMFIICASIFWISRFSVSYTYDSWHEYVNGPITGLYYSGVGTFETGIMNIFIVGTIIAFVMPFFVYSYRFDKTSSDAFLQFPSKKNQIKMIKVLLGLACVIAIISVAYWLGVLITFVKYQSINIPSEGKWVVVWPEEETTAILTKKYSIKWIYYLISYLFIIGSVIGTYFFNSLLVSLGNNFVTSAIYCILGNILMGFTVSFLVEYRNTFVTNYDYLLRMERYIIGPGLDVSFLREELEPKFTVGANTYYYGFSNESIVCLIIGFVLRYASLPLVLLLKDPSGEYFGQPGHKNPWYSVIIYGAMISISVIVACSFDEGLDVLPLIFILLAGVSYYLIVSIFNKNFKLGKRDIISLCSVVGCMLLLSFAALF